MRHAVGAYKPPLGAVVKSYGVERKGKGFNEGVRYVKRS
jgi:hypothetical protein